LIIGFIVYEWDDWDCILGVMKGGNWGIVDEEDLGERQRFEYSEVFYAL
jgi:hypothetical protein